MVGGQRRSPTIRAFAPRAPARRAPGPRRRRAEPVRARRSVATTGRRPTSPGRRSAAVTCSAARPTGRRCCAAGARGSGRPAPTARSAPWPRCDGPRSTAIGDLVDVAALDALMFSQPLYPVTWFQVAGEPFRPLRSSQLPSVHPTADGWVSLQTTTGQQWLDFCMMVGRDDWYDDERMARGTYRTLHRAEIEPVIDEWTSARTTAEIVELATRCASRWPRSATARTSRTSHHLVDGGWFAENARRVRATVGALPPRRWRDTATRSRPRRPSGATPTSPRPAGDHAARRRRTTSSRASRPARRRCRSPGSASLDLTAFWAGPLIGYACAILGAEVIHVESTQAARRHPLNTTRPMSEPQWWEWCPMFQGSNTNKLDVAVELDTERGPRAVPRPRRGQRRGDRQLQPACARAARPRPGRPPGERTRSWSCCARRRTASTGPWRERLAYAPTIEAQAGIAWITGFPDRGPEPPSGVADAMGGAHATVRAPPRARAPAAAPAGACSSSAPWSGASLNLAAEQIVEYSAYGRLLERRGNRSRRRASRKACTAPPTSTRDGTQDRWIAISVADDDQWQALCRVMQRGLGRRPCACHRGRPSRRRGRARRAHRRLVRDPQHRRDRAHAVGRGRPGEPVVPAHEHDRLPQVGGARLFEPVEHPVTGTADFIGAPFRHANGPRVAQPPALAVARRAQPRRVHAHPRATDDEVDALDADGVIGDAVVGGVLH